MENDSEVKRTEEKLVLSYRTQFSENSRIKSVAMGLETDYIKFAMQMRLESEKIITASQHN